MPEPTDAMSEHPRVIVVGAGITGLTTAYRLVTDHPDLEVTVIEAADRVGGKILTTPFDGRPVDCGADAFLARVPEAVGLCRELGLGDDLVSPAARNAYLFTGGGLHRFPEGLVLGVPTDLDALAAWGVVSSEGVARAAEDLTMPGTPFTDDESVGSLVRRRLGDEVFEALVAPLLSGVNAGDADALSVAAGAPQFAFALRDQQSLIAGLRAQAAASDPDAPVFYGLPTGSQTLTDTLAARIRAAGATIVLGTTVARIVDTTDGAPGQAGDDAHRYRLTLADGATIDADAMVLTIPDFAAAPLLAPLEPAVAVDLAAVEYASAIMVTLAVPKGAIGRPLDGSGVLVDRREGRLVTAASWASSKWAHYDRPDTALLRVSAGRHDDPRALGMGDDELLAAMLADLEVIMALTGPPTEVRITRWMEGLPQFRPGHLDRMRLGAARLAATRPGLVATGAGHAGLGIPVCIRQGTGAAASVAETLGRGPR